MGVSKNKLQTGPIVINDPDGPGLIKAIGKMAGRLLSKHWDGIQEFRGDAEDNKLAITIKVGLDYTPGEPALKVDIGYSKSVRDSANATVTDPNQGTFTEIEAATETEIPQPPNEDDKGEDKGGKPKPRGRKPKDDGTAAQN